MLDEIYVCERQHLGRFWAQCEQEEFSWSLGPIVDVLPRLRVRRIKPMRLADPWVYATVGAWEITATTNHGIEFILLSPSEDPRHVELLSMVANMHSDLRHRVKVGSVLPIGRGWAGNGSATNLLVSLPYPFGPDLEHLDCGATHIRYLWLVPITDDEAQLVRTQGLEALEARFDAAEVNMVDPSRAPVV